MEMTKIGHERRAMLASPVPIFSNGTYSGLGARRSVEWGKVRCIGVIAISVKVDSLLQQFQALTVEQQIKVAEAIDRLTWAKRWAAVCERVSMRLQSLPPLPDDQVDEMVQTVRREKPLSARSLTPPS